MKKIAIVIFDHFTDIDLFLMWDILCRNKTDWQVKILGTKEQHQSTHGLLVTTHGNIMEANNADVVLFSSGKIGISTVIKDKIFLETFSLNSQKQLIGSICAGSFILAKLGLLNNGPATTHPEAKSELQAMGVEVIDKPFVCNGNVATAGGCLSAQYLVAWVIERLFGIDKRLESLKVISPAGQNEIYERLVTETLHGSGGIKAPDLVDKGDYVYNHL
ncbi:MAG: DJ-1/PfpI family protein [Candidatus Berkiella sp.]|uniref:DJ-1/PfpI family protein n=1 Tax=Candidatus Berkiella aquae TaxID=295108 RepID=A0A0Q9YT39_9GAMM|nr:DJ-1/PfpI family protein [Candidatus Berkiella aquae]MCS5712903.1 DJ-1/PfpI family protein [Candidatus Berkiella aquae]